MPGTSSSNSYNTTKPLPGGSATGMNFIGSSGRFGAGSSTGYGGTSDLSPPIVKVQSSNYGTGATPAFLGGSSGASNSEAMELKRKI